MKKLFKWLIIIILLGSIGYLTYKSLIINPLNQVLVIYYKIPGKMICYQKNGTFINLFQGIPKNSITKSFPLNKQIYSFDFEKEIVLLDKTIPFLKYNIKCEYTLDFSQYSNIFRDFNSIQDVNNLLKNDVTAFLSQKINDNLLNNVDLNINKTTLEKEINNWAKEKYSTSFLKIMSISVDNVYIIPHFDNNKLTKLINDNFEYEENFKLDLRKIELDKLRLEKLAENEVAYLTIIGEYIKQNPLILKYLLVTKIDKNNIILNQTLDSDFDFSASLKEKVIKKALEK